MNVCCATLLSNGLVGSACVQAQLSDLRGRACRLNRKRIGEEGVLSDIIPALFILPGLKLVFFQASNPDIHGDRLPATQHTSCRLLRLELAVHVDRAYRQPIDVQPSTLFPLFCQCARVCLHCFEGRLSRATVASSRMSTSRSSMSSRAASTALTDRPVFKP